MPLDPNFVVVMDKARILHVEEIDLIETKAGAELCYLVPTLRIFRGCLAKYHGTE